jgi:hypothetical protein
MPAFPSQYDHGMGQIESWIGMNLRDYFAAKAIHAIAVGLGSDFGYNQNTYFKSAKEAYEIADAMLEAREK